MRKALSTLVVLGLAAGLAIVVALPADAKTTGQQSDPAARGKYLATIAGCGGCHTPLDPQTGASMLEKYMAGGQPYEGPWGIVYSANLTPDQETGLGKRTDADIRRVFHEGVLPDGRRVVLMPWPSVGQIALTIAGAVVVGIGVVVMVIMARRVHKR